MREEDFTEDSIPSDDEDRRIRRFQFMSFWVLTYFLAWGLWAAGCLDDRPTALILLLLVPPILALASNLFINFIPSIPASLFYPTGRTVPTYENGRYQTDMDEAKKLVREERWGEAITLYRQILQEIPKQCEARFNLARLYEKAGYKGLAFNEYHKIIDLKEEMGASRVLVSESERAMKELRDQLRPK